MFAYTHVVPGVFEEQISQTQTDGSVGGPYEESDSVSNTSISHYFTNSEALSTSYSHQTTYTYPGPDPAYGTSQTETGYTLSSYSSGTRPRSVSSIQVSWTTFSTNSITSSSSSGTQSTGPAGSSTGVDSWTYRLHSTQTYQFSTVFFQNSMTTISGSAQGTTSNTITFSTSASGTTLCPIFILGRPTVQRWYVDRDGPPPLRRAAVAFAATHVSDSAGLASLSAGSNSYATDLGFASLSGSSTTTDQEVLIDQYGYVETVTIGSTGRTTLKTGISGSSITFSSGHPARFTGENSLTGFLEASRKSLSSSAVFWGSSFGQSASFSPSISDTAWFPVEICNGLYAPSVFTSPIVRGSTTLYWSRSSSSWHLFGITSNSTTRSTYQISFQVTGTPATTAVPASYARGATTAVLGPLVPITGLSMNHISVSTNLGSDQSGLAWYSSVQASSAGSTSAFSSASSSSTFAFGTAAGLDPATYANSSISWAVQHLIETMSLATWRYSSDGRGSIPSICPAHKWNEAHRLDPVSVIE